MKMGEKLTRDFKTSIMIAVNRFYGLFAMKLRAWRNWQTRWT